MKLSEKKLQELKEKETSIEDLDAEYFIDPENDEDEIEVDNVLKLLNENICSFEKIVDRFKSIKNEYDDLCLKYLLSIEKLFEELIKNNRLSKEDLRYLLNRIDKSYELRDLCCNTSLIKYILNEIVLNEELVDRFSIIVENNEWYENLNISTIFDLIEFLNENNEEILKLNALNKYMHSFDEDQTLELSELIQNNETAKDKLIQIIDNHVESNYNFDSLMSCLKKVEKKNLLNI